MDLKKEKRGYRIKKMKRKGSKRWYSALDNMSPNEYIKKERRDD